MLEEASRRQARGSDVLVAAVDAPDREDIVAELDHLDLLGDGSAVDTAAVLSRRPEVVCMDDLTAGTTTAERRFAAARRFADAGITVVGTIQLGRLADSPDQREAGPRSALLDEPALLALADEVELVDVPPSILIDRVRRGAVVPPAEVTEALATTFAPERLRAERERAFRLVAEHGERRLAGYTGLHADQPDEDREPSILACAAPWPGMEPLIRRSAALAAQVGGEFRVALAAPAASGPQEEAAGRYQALTAQLGGEFVRLSGSPAAEALASFAHEHAVTELVLSRAGPPGRYPMLRDLARLVEGAELHVLPA